MIRSLIKKKFPAARLALTVGLGGSLLALNAAHAQVVSNPDATTSTATSADAAGPADRVFVTGSNIPTAAEAGTARVDTIDEAARDRTGQQDVLSVLTQADPSFSGGGNLGQSNAGILSGGTLGGSSVTIHGLPTLVLLNGRRVADAAAAASGSNAFVDVNAFPTALIKRVEVLKDGASAIYGSEAIGGVVNIILNQEFRGLEIDGRYGFTEKSDIKDKRISAIVGLGDDKTSIVLGGQYTEQDPIFGRDRGFSTIVSNSHNSPTFSGQIGLINNLTNAEDIYRLTGNNLSPLPTTPLGSVTTPNGVTNIGAYALVTGNPNVGPYDSALTPTITLDQNRTNFFGEFAREIWADHITVYGEFLYAHDYAESYLNAQPLGTGFDVSIPAGGTVPADSTTNLPVLSPFGFPITLGAAETNDTAIDVKARFLDFPRITRTDNDFYRVVAGLKGNIIKSIDLDYDISFNTSQNEVNFKNYNLVILNKLNAAISNGQIDIFSTANQDAALVAAGVFGTQFADFKTALNVFDAGITAFPVKLPAGPLGVAFGYEYRFEKFRAEASPNDFVNSPTIQNINVGRDIDAAYAEASIPVISPTMKIPGVYSLDLDGAVRMEKYEDINSSFVPKASFVYRPIEDIAVRGSFSKSFIAPSLYQTSGPAGIGSTDPLTVAGDNGISYQGSVETGSNPKLVPATADTYSVGLVLSPKKIPGLTISGDFFHVELKNQVGSIPEQTIATSVNALGPASPYASLVHKFTVNGPEVTAPGQLVGPGLANYFFIDTNANVGLSRIAGVDFNTNYEHDFDNGGPTRFGAVTIGINGVYYLQYKQEDLPGEAAYDTIGFYQGTGGNGAGNEVPSYKLAPYTEYRWGGFKASALMNYTPSVRDAHLTALSTYEGPTKDGYLSKIRDYYVINLLFSYTFGLNKPAPGAAPAPAPKDGKDGGKQVVSKEVAKQKSTFPNLLDGLSLGFGINNVTNARPPQIFESPDSTGTDAALYDPYQRLYYFTIEKKF